jgi:hypothetical protein
LSELKVEVASAETPIEASPTQTISIPIIPEPIPEPVIETSTEEEIRDEISGAQEFTSELIETEEEPALEEEFIIEFVVEKPQAAPMIEEPQKVQTEEKVITASLSRNDLLSRADNSIGSTLANKKISDIKQAINIGDRFRFQRELFKGNGEDMNKTLSYINQLATIDEVQSFLQSKYNWLSENETVEDFYQIVKRRFL